MKIQVVIDLENVEEISSDELSGIREALALALTEELNYSTVRVCSLEVEE
jgi:hypothetical protein